MFHFRQYKNYIISGAFYLLFIGLIVSRCDKNGYKKVIDYWKMQEYNFKVISVSGSRDYIIKGIGADGKERDYVVSNFWRIGDSINPGDSIIKKVGSMQLKIVKKDTTLLFPLVIKGITVKE